MGLRYSVVTPAWNEADNLPRLAACLDAQSVRPVTWVIVDTGSTDATRSVAADLAERHAWARAIDSPRTSRREELPSSGASRRA